MTNIVKFFYTSLLAVLLCLPAKAQQANNAFQANLYNQEYDVFLNINFADMIESIPGHELYGHLPGYLGKTTSSFYWLILSAEQDKETATLQMVNDYGSEDLTATLTQTSDSTFVLTQGKGSIIKLPYEKKWQKLPKSLEFKKRR